MAICNQCGRKYRMNWVRMQPCPACRGHQSNKEMVVRTRDTSNAVALGVVIGGLLQARTDDQRPKRWQNIGWDQIVEDVDEAASALDSLQAEKLVTNPEFWEEHDWYLTLDKIGDELWSDPEGEWNMERMTRCLVAL